MIESDRMRRNRETSSLEESAGERRRSHKVLA